MTPKSHMTVAVTVKVHRRLRLLSASLGVSMLSIIDNALEQAYGPLARRLEAADRPQAKQGRSG